MDRKTRAMRAALAGTTTALCLASTLLFGACAMKLQNDDFPVMRLTNPPAADAQPSQYPARCRGVVMRFIVGALALAVLGVLIGMPAALVLGWSPLSAANRHN